jgi:hypothetical protein
MLEVLKDIRYNQIQILTLLQEKHIRFTPPPVNLIPEKKVIPKSDVFKRGQD